MKKYILVADPQVKEDLKEARDFLNSRQKGFGKKFLDEYRTTLKTLQINPFFQIRYKQINCIPLKSFKYMIHFNLDEMKKIITIYAVISTYLNPNEKWL